MATGKWRPDKGQIDLWAEWFKTHVPVCHVQELWKIVQSPEEAKKFADKFYRDNESHFRRKGIAKWKVREALFRVFNELRIYPHAERRQQLIDDVLTVYDELAQSMFRKLEVPFQYEDNAGKWVDHPEIPIKKPHEIETEIIERMEPDLEKMMKELHRQGKSTREIAALLGMPKSTVHRRLKRREKEI